jgi:hypothetical protein
MSIRVVFTPVRLGIADIVEQEAGNRSSPSWLYDGSVRLLSTIKVFHNQIFDFAETKIHCLLMS